jgi:hypothetical protein
MRKAIAMVVLSIWVLSQAVSSQVRDVVKAMLPDGNVRRLAMPKPSERERVIRRLNAAQAGAEGSRAQEVAFLLAVLGADYERHRDYLLWVMKGCEVPEIKHGCNFMTGDYLIFLYEHGHPEILAPLLSSNANSYNAAGSESVGSFMSELVAKSPKEFLDAVRSFPPSKQERVCFLAGAGDGGGITPAELRKVRKQLGAMNEETARRCLQQIEKANKPEQR